MSSEAKAAPAFKAAPLSLDVVPAAGARGGMVGGAAGLAFERSGRMMIFEGKAPVRFVPRFSRQNAQLVGATKRMIMLPYQSVIHACSPKSASVLFDWLHKRSSALVWVLD
ncbi:hypothetical protein [Mesorhizobium hawassense]|uniref:hypothetical protein n=1 Tax=Mesorhizobium hawassense TaxID=1209954 RepID=UPI001FDF7020|nr:hypothetical protein [Mesorhizobium hawassense]